MIIDSMIITKLKLNKYADKAILTPPKEVTFSDDFTNWDRKLSKEKYDLILAFVLDDKELRKTLDDIIQKDLLNTEGYVFFAYPKRGNKIYDTYIHRDNLFEIANVDEATGYISDSDYKFSRLVGLNDVFTIVGIKKTLKKAKAEKKKVDYTTFIPKLEVELNNHNDAYKFYQTLTSGYKKQWAEFIYSAKSDETIQKRIDETISLLEKGYKSKNLYQQDKNKK